MPPTGPPTGAPAGVDMNLIREALMRRAQGGGGTPAISQVTPPTGATPAGGPNVPGPTPPGMPVPGAPPPSSIPGQTSPPPASGATPPQAAAKALGGATGFPDPETRDMAKTLLAKLVQFL